MQQWTILCTSWTQLPECIHRTMKAIGTGWKTSLKEWKDAMSPNWHPIWMCYVVWAIWLHIRRNYGQHNRWHSQRIPCTLGLCVLLSSVTFCLLRAFVPCVFLSLIDSSDWISKLLSVSHFVPTSPAYTVLLTSSSMIAKYDVIGSIWPLVHSLGLIQFGHFQDVPNLRGRIPSTGCKNGLHWIREN